ncbi:MAG TPA: TIGR02281 family clan AA aspartic protease [Caulobacteraceae bacterium]|nr:TIGR02281 family clan AA aspartic protease [Caulobacteraceae bacterium]
MSQEGGPWAHMRPEPERPSPPRPPMMRGRIAWPVVVLVLGLLGLMLALWRAFPEARLNGQDWGNGLYLVGFALVVAAGLSRMGRTSPVRILQHGAIWVAIAAGIALGFAYRDEIMGVPQRLAIAFGTGRPVATGAHELVIGEDDRGAFEVVAQVNGQPVRFMIDTGATDTVLAPQDARRLGVDVSGLKFDQPAETANGQGHGAAYVAQSLEVGPIRLSDFPMEINQAPMSSSLLGLSFLKRLDSFEVRGSRLYLKWGAKTGS